MKADLLRGNVIKVKQLLKKKSEIKLRNTDYDMQVEWKTIPEVSSGVSKVFVFFFPRFWEE